LISKLLLFIYFCNKLNKTKVFRYEILYLFKNNGIYLKQN